MCVRLCGQREGERGGGWWGVHRAVGVALLGYGEVDGVQRHAGRVEEMEKVEEEW